MTKPIKYEHEFEASAQELGVSVELLHEGDSIAKDFYSKQGDEEFNLTMEGFCKRVWAPYFNEKWNLIDLTRPNSAILQVGKMAIPESAKIEIKKALKGIFPCDGIMYRWGYMLPFDYKFKLKTTGGIGIEAEDYDGYFKKYVELSIPLWLLIWDNWQKKRFAHKVQNPIKYGEPTNYNGYTGDKYYYDITAYCQEVKLMPFIMPPEPKNGLEEIALHLKSQDANWKGGKLKLEPNSERKIVEYLSDNRMSHLYNILKSSKKLVGSQSAEP